MSLIPPIIINHALLVFAVYVLGLILYVWRVRSQKLSLKIAIQLAVITLTSGFIGARLIDIFYLSPALYKTDSKMIYTFWLGNYSFYGGLWTAVFCGYLFLKLKKESPLVWANLCAPLISLCYGLGRIGCVLEGCCFGKACPLAYDAYSFHGRYPTQIYAVIADVLIALFLFWRGRKQPRNLFFQWMYLSGAARLVMEYFRDDFQELNIYGYSASSWIALVMIIAGIVLSVIPSKAERNHHL